MSTANPDGCYDYPQYWDLAFRDETQLEADFFDAAFARYCDFPVDRVIEPGCGGGRLVLELAKRGYNVTAFDLNARCVRYVKRRLRRRGLKADVFLGDMRDVRIEPPADAAICTFDTFRHLTSEADARRHLEAVAASLRPGGVYILGFHLLPLDADPEATERWTAQQGRTKVTTTLRVLDSNRRRRIEVIRFSLRVRSGGRDLKLRSDFPLRMYTADQFRRLLKSVPSLQLLDTFDFWYEIDEPLELTDELNDVVFVLRKRLR